MGSKDVTDSKTDNQDAQTTASLTNTDPSDLQDGFLLIEGGTFQMGPGIWLRHSIYDKKSGCPEDAYGLGRSL